MNLHIKQKLISTLLPFIGLGSFIFLFIVGFIFFSYLLIIGVIIGLILFSLAYWRAKFFTHKLKKNTEEMQKQRRQNRTIEHE